MSENLREQAETVGVQNEKLQLLTSSPEWGMLRAFIESQIRQRMDEVMLTHITNMADAQKHNYRMGECAFGRMLLVYVESNFAVTKETVELYKQALSEQGEQDAG